MSSSTTRKTAFARIPRSKSSLPNGGRPLVRIDKRFLDEFSAARLGPDLSTVLTKTGSELSITVMANGKGNYGVTKAGATIADAPDVQKIQTLTNFINDERKAVLKSSVSKNTRAMLAGIVHTSRVEANVEFVPRPITKINKSFVDVFRTVENQANILALNTKAIEATPAAGAANEIVKGHLIDSSARANEALGKFLFYRGGLTGNEENPRKLNEFLLEAQVIGWVFHRLTAQKLQLTGKDFEFRRIYFPRDITKGLTISYQELVTHDLRNNQGQVLQGLRPLASVWSEAFIRIACNIPAEWDVGKFGPDDPAKVLKNIPMMVVPFPGATTVEENLSALARSQDRGLNFSVGVSSSSADILKFLGTVPKRIFHAILPRPFVKTVVLNKIFPGFVYNPLEEKKGYYAQLATWAKQPDTEVNWFDRVFSTPRTLAEHPDELAGVFENCLQAILDYGPGEAIELAAREASKAKVRIPANLGKDPKPVWDEFVNSKKALSDEQVGFIINPILDVELTAKKKKDRDESGVRTARSALTAAGEGLVEDLALKKYKELSSRVGTWLRTFLTGTVQSAVAEIIHARLDASLANPVTFTSQDSSSFLTGTGGPDDSGPGGDDSDMESDHEEENPDEAS